jgi:hypothetical protein
MMLRKHVGRRLTDDQEAILYDGGGILSFVDLETTFGTMEAAKAAWAIHGERLTAESDLKPWAWWQWTATEEEKEAERALQERRRHAAKTEPIRIDPIAKVIPFTHRLVFPHHGGNRTNHS